MPLTGTGTGYIDIIPVLLEFTDSVFEVWICPRVLEDSRGRSRHFLARDRKHGSSSGKCPLEGPWTEKEELSHLNQVSSLHTISLSF